MVKKVTKPPFHRERRIHMMPRQLISISRVVYTTIIIELYDIILGDNAAYTASFL